MGGVLVRLEFSVWLAVFPSHISSLSPSCHSGKFLFLGVSLFFFSRSPFYLLPSCFSLGCWWGEKGSQAGCCYCCWNTEELDVEPSETSLAR